VEELCGTEFSRWTVSELCKGVDVTVREWSHRSLGLQEYPFLLVDALVIRVRKDGRVLIATGINREGYRQIPGLVIGHSEAD